MGTLSLLDKTLVTYEPHPLGHSLAQKLWQQGVPRNRQVGIATEAHVILYDELTQAVKGFAEYPLILHIVVAPEKPKAIPKGIFWIKPDIRNFTSLIRVLNPGGET